jgi:glyoxylase-like metal-dependent hydrolase (beta-lactamase superfamily II)
MWTPMNGLLLRRAGRTILVDAGPGVLSHLWTHGRIERDQAAALAAAGAAAEQVDAVILTHLDDDHAGGVLDGDWPGGLRLAFPNARIAAHREAIAAVAAGEGLPIGIEERRTMIELLRSLGVLDPYDPGEIFPGVTLRPARGHRAGHCVVEVAGRNPLVHVADTLHHRSHIEHPDWDGAADDDPALALETRRAVLAELAASETRAVASHLEGAFAITRSAGGFALAGTAA